MGLCLPGALKLSSCQWKPYDGEDSWWRVWGCPSAPMTGPFLAVLLHSQQSCAVSHFCFFNVLMFVFVPLVWGWNTLKRLWVWEHMRRFICGCILLKTNSPKNVFQPCACVGARVHAFLCLRERASAFVCAPVCARMHVYLSLCICELAFYMSVMQPTEGLVSISRGRGALTPACD